MSQAAVNGNVATVTIPANTQAFYTLMTAGIWKQRVTVGIDGTTTPYHSNGASRNECIHAGCIALEASERTLTLTFEQCEDDKNWTPSNLVTQLPSANGNLTSFFFAGRDSGGALRDCPDGFPNCSALVYFYAGYAY